MRLVFVNPPNDPFTPAGILIEPIDLLGLATLARSMGHEVRLLDMDAGRLRAGGMNVSLGGDWPDAVVVACDYHIPLHGDRAASQVREILAEARLRGCRTILGGKLATYGSDGDILASGADVSLAHDMEPGLAALLAPGGWPDGPLPGVPGARWREGDTLGRSSLPRVRPDVSGLPIPDRGLVNLDDYIDVRTLLSSRGCPLRCSFCHVPGFWGAWQGRGAESVAAEIEGLAAAGARKVLFLDDNAIVDHRRMRLICAILRERGVRVAMGCLGSVSRADERLFAEMAEAGFRWIHFGAESGDDEALASMGKRADAAATRRAVAAAQSAGMRVRTSWIIDAPGINADGLRRTEDLILGMGSEEVRLHFLALRPGSRLRTENPGLSSTVFIHGSRQGVDLTAAGPEEVDASAGRVVSALRDRGYAFVEDISDFADMDALRHRTPGLKVVSVCPMRYGMGWAA